MGGGVEGSVRGGCEEARGDSAWDGDAAECGQCDGGELGEWALGEGEEGERGGERP